MLVIETNGIHLHYRDEGSDNAPVIVLINSLGTDFRAWDEVSDRLRDRYRIIRYDKRGHGLSDAPRAPYSIDDHVGDLTGLLDALGLHQVILCGLSVGGMIALSYTHLHPKRVAALVLADTAHQIGTAAMWNSRLEAIQTGGLASIAEPVMERWFTKHYRENQEQAMAVWTNMLCRTPEEGYRGTCMAIRDADLTEAARGLRVATLCLCGDEDGATSPALVQSLAELIPQSEFHLIEQAGHLPCVEQPQAFVTHLRDFIEDRNFDQPTL